MKIKIYLHNYKYGPEENWKPIYDEIINYINNSGITTDKNFDELKVFNKDTPELFEWLTLENLWSDAMESTEEYYILYIHNKGVTHTDYAIKHAKYWRQYMLYFCVTKWQNCIKELEKFNAVGVDLSQENDNIWFVGNFWWTKSSYVKKLENPIKFINDRMYAEMWLGSKTTLSDFKSLHNSNINHYEIGYKQNFYL
jgi:hypothetical protein